MADLQDLHRALQTLAEGGKTARVSFYYVAGEGKLLSGSIAVEAGHTCHVQFQGLPAETALAAIPGLQFAKVTSLPGVTVEHGPDPVPMSTLLDRLDPRHRPAPVVAAPVARVAPIEAPAVKAVKVAPAYSDVALQDDAVSLLEPLFGVGAARKVEEFAKQSPPARQPREFIDRCRQHAAMMLGPKKAEELFGALYGRLPQ